MSHPLVNYGQRVGDVMYVRATHEQVCRYRECGLSVLALLVGSKKPAIDWKRQQDAYATDGEVEKWFRGPEEHNVGIVTGKISSLVVVDCDSKSTARQFFCQHKAATMVIVETPRGAHFYFSWPGHEVRNSCGDDFDVRGDGGYVVAPPSIVNGCAYRFVPGFDNLRELLPLPATLERPERSPQKAISDASMDRLTRISRARAYLARVEGAVSGQHGHDRTLYAACCLIQKFELSIEEAWPLMLEYNDRCVPPWDLKSLARKLTEAARLKGEKPADLRA